LLWCTTARVQLTAVSTPVKPVVERTVGQTAGNCLKYQVGVATTYRIKPSQITPFSATKAARLLVEKSRRGGVDNDPLKAEGLPTV